MPFSYRALRPGDVRLLEVVTGANDRDLRFRMKHVHREVAPQYTAVSYTWGNDEATEPIWIDEECFRVRPNLWGCLYYLGRKAGWKHIWADAICIDQNNIHEKNEQVRTMGQTYANAGRFLCG